MSIMKIYYLLTQKKYQKTLSKRFKRKKTKTKIGKNEELVEFTQMSEKFNKQMYNVHKDIPISFDNTSGITNDDLEFTTKLVNSGNISVIFFDSRLFRTVVR